MAQRTITHETAAHKIFEGKADWEGYKDGDTIAIDFESKSHGLLHRFYRFGSVINSALKYCECPFDEVESAKSRGHELHWLNQQAVMITSGHADQEIAFMQKHGDVIKFHGKRFKIVETPNNNVKLEMESN